MLWITVLAVWCTSACARAAVQGSDKPYYPAENHAQLFEQFKVTYNKHYATQKENQHRFEIFKNNLNNINKLNAEYKETVYGITKFSDLTKEEFIARNTGLLVDKSRKPIPPPLLDLSSFEAPESFDWREKNVVTRVKDQGDCGACWAFCTTGCLESQYARNYGKLVDFSEMQLVDCDTFDGGCDGGMPSSAARYMILNGMQTNESYPYIPDENDCDYDPKKVAVHVKDFKNYAGINEDLLKKVLYNEGPLAITIDSYPIHGYKGGVIRDCKHNYISHGVLLVGYGKENGVDYWLVKNSWGTTWGDKGYFKMERGVDCLGLTTGKFSEIIQVLV